MTHTQKILIVDDDIISSLVTGKNLEKRGFANTKIVKTGTEALEIIAEFNPEVVLMDMRLAGEFDGVQTTLIIRKVSQVPVIFFSATVDQNEIDRAKAIANTRFFDRFTLFDTVVETILQMTPPKV
ncbi:MAG: response regulator [Flavobacteriaceae bacterium]|nr:response regulator [Flavobacteriaceae bacterium]